MRGSSATSRLPSTKYGILSATFVVFTIVITDFGNPMVIGGDYSVLATEIYNQVSGQGNFQMGAVIGVMLLVPAALAVIAEKWIMRRHHATITERSQPLRIVREPWRDRAASRSPLAICAMIAAIVLVVVVASFVTLWPYNMHVSLRHYRFEVQNGLQPLWTSIWVSLMAAGVGVVVTIGGACVTRRLRNVDRPSACTSCRYFPRPCREWCSAWAISSCSTIRAIRWNSCTARC